MEHICGNYHYGDMSVIRECCVAYAKDRKAAVLKYALTEGHPSYREFTEIWNPLTNAEMKLVGDICRNFEMGTGFSERQSMQAVDSNAEGL